MTFTVNLTSVMISGNGIVTTPKTGVLEGFLLGTGLLGLVETARRKLQLGT